jgi:hypothetical protein
MLIGRRVPKLLTMPELEVRIGLNVYATWSSHPWLLNGASSAANFGFARLSSA